MIRFVQTGEYRSTSVKISRFVNGSEVIGDGFPVMENLLDAFGSFPALTEREFVYLSPSSIKLREAAFKNNLYTKYPWLHPEDFSGSPSGTDHEVCIPDLTISEGVISITDNTAITIFFDSSGSMDTTLAPLNEMKNTLLRDLLLPYYNNDTVLYDQRVRIVVNSSERTFYMFRNLGRPIAQKHLIMVFQDEADNRYHTTESIIPRTENFNTDISALRTMIEGRTPNTYRGILFQVTYPGDHGIQFRRFIQAVKEGSTDYPSPYNLSDRPEIGFEFDVTEAGTPQYYMDLILLKMRELGYRI